MLGKARFRCAIIILLLVSAYMVFQVLGSEGIPPWRSHRLALTVVTDSLDSESFSVIDSSDSNDINGIYLAVIQVQIIESPVYFRDEFNFLSQGFNRIEIGRKVEIRPGFSFTAEANDASIDLEYLQSTEFLRSTILGSIEGHELSPAMDRIVRGGPTLAGKVYNYPRAVAAIAAGLVWVLGWLAMLVELVLAHIRRKRLRHRCFNDLCLNCAYKLNRGMSQCPECGEAVDWRAYPTSRI